MAHNLSHEELADVPLMYGAAGGNAAEAVRMYRDRFPNRFIPGARMFMAIDRRFVEHGGFNVIRRGPPRPVLDAIEADVLEYFADRNRQVPELQLVTWEYRITWLYGVFSMPTIYIRIIFRLFRI